MIENAFCSFDWELFALVATPIISFLAFLVYGAALFTSIKQNKITTSASLIPYYEEEVRNLIESGSALKLEDSSLNKTLNAFDFPSHFISAFVFLQSDIYYQKDVEEGRFNGGLKYEDLKDRPYSRSILFLLEFFSEMTEMNQHLKRIKQIIKNVESSELTESHKKILRWKIRNKLALPFMVIYFDMKWNKIVHTEIPISTPFDWDSRHYLTLFKVEETEFFKTLQWIDKKLTLN